VPIERRGGDASRITSLGIEQWVQHASSGWRHTRSGSVGRPKISHAVGR
jgi:hypothetical protein